MSDQRDRLVKKFEEEKAVSGANQVSEEDNLIGPYTKDENGVSKIDYKKLKPNVCYLVCLALTCSLSSM